MHNPDNTPIRRFFPGGNTAYGFHSFYDQIIAPDAARIIILKGGPGVGKSTFMRGIAEAMSARGFETEYMHCSSDNNSLDGVVFPRIGVALLDGTAPHVVDPRNPGCVDEIVHLGEYWNEAGIAARKQEILRTNREIGRSFARAYRFLRAAKEIRDARAVQAAVRLRPGRLNLLAAELASELYGDLPIAAEPGRIRRLFASAVTPDGPRHHLDTIFARAGKLIILRGEPGTGKSTLLAKLATAAVERGLTAEQLHCGFDPEHIEHLYLPGLGAGLTTVNDYHAYAGSGTAIVDLDSCLAPGGTEEENDAAADRTLYRDLIGRAVAAIARAKRLHDEMETYYTPNMDFKRLTDLRDRILRRILGYAETARDK